MALSSLGSLLVCPANIYSHVRVMYAIGGGKRIACLKDGRSPNGLQNLEHHEHWEQAEGWFSFPLSRSRIAGLQVATRSWRREETLADLRGWCRRFLSRAACLSAYATACQFGEAKNRRYWRGFALCRVGLLMARACYMTSANPRPPRSIPLKVIAREPNSPRIKRLERFICISWKTQWLVGTR